MSDAIPSLRAIAIAIGGKISGGQVVAPGPGHSKLDKSMSVKLSPYAPDGFIVCAHSPRDDWRACRDHVRERLGMERVSPRRAASPRPVPAASQAPAEDDVDRIAAAISLWRASVNPIGTVVERYFASRRLEIGDLAGSVIRWNERIGAAISLFRAIDDGAPQAVSRTYITPDARKIDRKFLGPVRRAAIMLDRFDDVTTGLHVGEGMETCQAARQLALRPTWALGSAGAIAAFPVLGGVEALTLLGEHDEASAHAVEACASRWHAAGREVRIIRPTVGNDMADVMEGDRT